MWVKYVDTLYGMLTMTLHRLPEYVYTHIRIHENYHYMHIYTHTHILLYHLYNSFLHTIHTHITYHVQPKRGLQCPTPGAR
jgi:hypothetical protein